MKKQINPTVKAHLIRSAFYLLLLVAVCAIPFALAQSRSRGTTKQSVAKPNGLAATNLPPLTKSISAWGARPNLASNPGASGPQAAAADGVVRAPAILSAVTAPNPVVRPDQACQFHVLIVYADTALPTQLQSQIQAQPNVISVDLFDAQIGTPTLAQLLQYQIVVPYSNFPFLDADTLGNNLADYVDGGGVVVQYGFSHYGPGQPYGVNGRWVSGNYNPYNYSTNTQFSAFSLGTFNAGHPLMAGVTMLNSDFDDIVTPAAGATQVAANNLGQSLVAYRPVGGQILRRAEIGER
jgi:hypothetical protein